MKKLKSITLMAGYTLWDKKKKRKNTDIREQLGIFNINKKLTQYKIRVNWREHIQKINGNRLQKNLNYKLEGKRNIGTPQTK